MDYERARGQIATGDLLLFRGRRLVSWLIQWRTKSVYSHVGIAVWIQVSETKRLCVLEALEGNGVRLYPLSRYLREGESVDWFRVTDPGINSQAAAAWALEQLGKRYASLWQMFRSFGVIGLVKLVSDAWGIPTKVDQDRWFCSCFAAHYLLAGGWVPEDNIDPSLMPPGEVALLPCLQRRGTLTFSSKDA